MHVWLGRGVVLAALDGLQVSKGVVQEEWQAKQAVWHAALLHMLLQRGKLPPKNAVGACCENRDNKHILGAVALRSIHASNGELLAVNVPWRHNCRQSKEPGSKCGAL